MPAKGTYPDISVDGFCAVGPCDRPTRNLSNPYCEPHYVRFKKGKSLDSPVITQNSPRLPCKYGGCKKTSESLGMCSGHYYQYRQGKELSPLAHKGDCRHDKCENAAINSKSHYCKEHIFRLNGEGYLVHSTSKGRKNIFLHVQVMEISLGRKLYSHENVHHKNGIRDDNNLDNLELWSTQQPNGQRVEDKIQWSKNFLASYGYAVSSNPKLKTKRHTDIVLKPENTPYLRYNATGYVLLRRADMQIGWSYFYHRAIMEEYLGRKLYEKENVHHINGDRSDNRIQNLELWTTRQPAGQRVEDKISWMIDFLGQYGYSVTKD